MQYRAIVIIIISTCNFPVLKLPSLYNQRNTEAYLGHEKKIIILPGQDNYLARAR